MPNLSRILYVDNENGYLRNDDLRHILGSVYVIRVQQKLRLMRELQDGNYDLAILECDLTWEDGFDVLRMLKEAHPKKPVIVATAQGSEDVIIASFKAGADDYVSLTPDRVGRLQEAVQEAWEKVQGRKSSRSATALERRDAVLRTLGFVSQQLFVTADLDAILPDLLGHLGESLNASRVYVFENHLDDNGRLQASQRFVWMASNHALDNGELREILYQPDFARWQQLLARGEPIHGQANMFQAEERTVLESYAICSLALLPISSGGQWWGFLSLEDCVQYRNWASYEIGALKSVAGALGAAIESRRLYNAAKRRLAEQRALLEASTATSSSLDLSTVLNRLAEQMGKALDVTSVYISDWKLETREVTVLAEYYGSEAKDSERISDLGYTYDVVNDFGSDVSRFQDGKPRINHVDDPESSELEREHLRRYGGKSALTVPFIVKGAVVGFAELWESRHHRDFSANEIALAQGIARQAAIAFENARLFAAERRQLQLAHTLQQVGALLTTSLKLEEVYEQIFDLLSEVVAFDSVSILLLQADGSLQLAAARGFPDLKVVDRVVQVMSDNWLTEFEDDTRFKVIPSTAHDATWVVTEHMKYIQSWIGALLMVKGHPIGILNVDNATPYAYDEQAGETVRAFANQAAVAIENARLYEEARQRANELEIVHQVAVATATVIDIDRLIERTTKFISERIYPDVFGFVLLDEASGMFRPHPSYHGLPPEGVATTVPLTNSITGRVVRTGRPVIVPDVREEPLYFPIVSDTSSEIAVPLHSDGRVIGVINVESRARNAFSNADLRFLKTLAGQVVTAIERAQLYENLEQHAAQLAEEVQRRTVELQSERDRMLAILESAGEGIMFTDCEGTILYVNPAMERQTGYSRDECLGKTPQLWKSKGTAPAIFNDMWQTILSGRRWHGELINRRKDGTLFDAAITISPLYGRKNELTGFVGVQADITRLKEVDRLKSKFIANVSHELRTPLTNIRMYLSLLERGQVTRWDHYLTVIHHETDRLTRLIQDLLDLSRLEAHGQPSNVGQIDVTSLIEKNVHTFSALAERKHIALRYNIPDTIPAIMADKSAIQQVINNLLANALAYTPRGGEVHVTAGDTSIAGRRMMWLRVTDNGPGINDDDLQRLFERFYRGEAALLSKAPGTGLGLAICKEIVENQGGQIEVDTAPGQGASFTVLWPVVSRKP